MDIRGTAMKMRAPSHEKPFPQTQHCAVNIYTRTAQKKPFLRNPGRKRRRKVKNPTERLYPIKSGVLKIEKKGKGQPS